MGHCPPCCCHCTDLPPLGWNTASDKELVTSPSATPTGTSRVSDLWANRPSRSSAVVLLTPWGLALHVWPEGRGDCPRLARCPARGQGALWMDRHLWNSCLPVLTRGRRKPSPLTLPVPTREAVCQAAILGRLHTPRPRWWSWTADHSSAPHLPTSCHSSCHYSYQQQSDAVTGTSSFPNY